LPLGVKIVPLGGMFTPSFTPRGQHSTVRTNRGANKELHPQGITSHLGDKIHPWGTTSPLGLGAKLRFTNVAMKPFVKKCIQGSGCMRQHFCETSKSGSTIFNPPTYFHDKHALRKLKVKWNPGGVAYVSAIVAYELWDRIPLGYRLVVKLVLYK
jgi:hypothetical protein